MPDRLNINFELWNIWRFGDIGEYLERDVPLTGHIIENPKAESKYS